MDTEKQVVAPEALSGAENAPMVKEDAKRAGLLNPEHEAGKEVTGSWQIDSRGDNAPIPVDSEMGRPDIPELASPEPTSPSQKQPPPPYETLEREDSTASTRVRALEPDATSESLPPRPEDRSAVGQLLSWIPSITRPGTQAPILKKPIVIPQLDVPPVGETVPFQRCYADVLAAYDVPMHEFVAFLDGLAVAQAPTSGLQGMKMFGAGVSMIPLPLIPLAGRGISALAGAGSGTSSSRAKLYLTRAMREYFTPRGLRLSIAKDDEIGTRYLRLPPDAPKLAPLTEATLTDSICNRRFEAIKPYVAELRYDVPAQSSDVKAVDKLAKKHLDRQMGKESKQLARLRQEQFHGRGFEGAVEEERKAGRLRWLVIEELR